MSTNEPFVTIREAATAIGIGRERLRTVCIRAGVAIDWGGSKQRKYIRVLLSEARQALLDNRYVHTLTEITPQRRSPVRRSSPEELDPLVTC